MNEPTRGRVGHRTAVRGGIVRIEIHHRLRNARPWGLPTNTGSNYLR